MSVERHRLSKTRYSTPWPRLAPRFESIVFCFLLCLPAAARGALVIATETSDSIIDSRGMTEEGGSNGFGTTYTANTGSSPPTIMASFTQSQGLPVGAMTLGGSTLYGMTPYGGANGDGIVYRIATSGGSIKTLCTFAGSNGQNPFENLTLIPGLHDLFDGFNSAFAPWDITSSLGPITDGGSLSRWTAPGCLIAGRVPTCEFCCGWQSALCGTVR